MIICDFEPEKLFLCKRKQKTRKNMKKETVLCAMLATATCATGGNTFFLVIDRARNSENVYMLSMIDEYDLQEFLDDEVETSHGIA